MDQHNRVLERLLSDSINYHQGELHTSKNSVKSLCDELYLYNNTLVEMPSISLAIAKDILLKHNPILNQYFRILYQILKFIATKCPESSLRKSEFNLSSFTQTSTSDTEKFYANIVRSFAPENIYYLLAINCFSRGSDDPYFLYQQLIERYEFLEHISFENTTMQQNQRLLDEIISPP